MSYMTFQKYSCNNEEYLLFDAGCNEDALDEAVFHRLQYSNHGNGVLGIIACSLFGENAPEFWDIEGHRHEADEEAMSIYRFYKASRKTTGEMCKTAPYCKGCEVTDPAECEQCIRNTGRVYVEHTA